ncbi:MAG: FAD-binding and (Fe-S)-binding domain-containing protein [Acidobacteriota bacterium]
MPHDDTFTRTCNQRTAAVPMSGMRAASRLSMIRSNRLVVADALPPGNTLAHDLAAGIEGEVRFDTASRAIYSHDASNYRQVPIGVVLPRHAGDVEHALRTCRAHGVPVLGRGGGTSLAGQCVNTAVVLDFSKYMQRVLGVDRARRRVRVEPGCVLDDLRGELSRHGLTYGPDPATHNHCTLGGMLGNNSCGIHSVMAEFYGPGARTADHVESLEIVTYDGLRLRVGATSDAELAAKIAGGGRVGEIYRALASLRDRYADLIRRRFAPIPRRVSGYNLDELLPENGFQVARALVGTESTCVTILEATLEVYPSRPHRALVVLGYPDVYSAADHVPQIREFRPVGLEGMDDKLIDDMRATGMHASDIKLLPRGKGWLLVELGADSRDEADDQAHRLMDALRREPNAPAMKLYDDPDEAEQVWQVRESGLGATAFIPGHRNFWPGWEDSAVPPDRAGEYLRELRALMHRHGLEAALYGHFGQGCIHCRIDFELSTPSGRETYRRFTDDAADLVVRFGGSLSGEHGDGQSRGELLVKQFGPELVEAFREFKHIWDPEDRMNPGKIVDGDTRTEHLELATYHPAPVETHFHPQQDHGDFRHAAIRCVGIGKGRRSDGGTMCPSYMVTHDEKHTTRGRAHALFEMMQGDLVTDGWASDAVKDTLDLCLACKGCKGDCPVHVDIATYKSEFLSHYYEHHARPRHAYAFGWIHRWALVASYVPEIANLMARTPGLRTLLARLAGMAPERPFPRFATHTFSRRHSGRATGRGRPVVLWPDTFNNYFFPETLEAAWLVLIDAGFDPVVPRGHVCCGRATYDYGMLDLAKRLWQRTFRVLDEAIRERWPIVGLEPSCVSAFRDELPALFPGDERASRLTHQARTLSELLIETGYEPPRVHAHAIVQGHCHHKSVLDFDKELQLLRAMKLDLEVPDSGCCGLAGSFGYEADHYDISMAIGERGILPAVRGAARDTIVLADGFSCREQIHQGAQRRAYHIAELIAVALEEGARMSRARGFERVEEPAALGVSPWPEITPAG